MKQNIINFFKNDKVKKGIIAIFAFMSVLVFSISLKKDDLSILISTNKIAKFIEKMYYSFSGNQILYIFTFIAFYIYYSKTYFDKNKICKTAVFISIFFAASMVLGYSYHTINSWDLVFGGWYQLFKSTLVGIGYYLMAYITIKKLYLWIDNYKYKKKKQNKVIEFIFEKHPFIMPFVIILICWLPYIISFYPGTVIGGDTRAEIYNFYHIENYTTSSINLISESQYINKHHSVLHTYILGGFMKLGEVIGNYNISMFLYTIIQVLVFIAVLSYTILWMKKRNIPIWLRVMSLLIYILLSFYPLFAINCAKDSYASILTLLYILFLFDMTIDKEKLKSKRFIFILIITMLLVMMFRNDGIYRIVLPFIIFIIVNRAYWKRLLGILLVLLLLFEAYDNILLPALKITDGSVREMLSVPFQQTARVVYVHGYDAYEEDDIEVINKILRYYTMAEDYDPGLADGIKNKFKKDSTNEDLINYFKVWFKYLFIYPTDYIEATLNNTYGYFYPNMNKNIGYTDNYQLDELFDIHFNDNFESERNAIIGYHLVVKKLPVISMIYNPAFHIYILLISMGYLVHKKYYKYIVVWSPSIVILLVCLVSPVNGHWRYTLPIIMSTPLMISMIYCIRNREKN